MYHTSFICSYGAGSLITLSNDGLTATVSFKTFAGEMWTSIPVSLLTRVIEESESIQQKNKKSAEAQKLDWERLVDEYWD